MPRCCSEPASASRLNVSAGRSGESAQVKVSGSSAFLLAAAVASSFA